MAQRRPTEQSVNPARGAILVVGAIVVGLVLLRHGLDTTTTVSSAPTHTTTTVAGLATGGDTTTTTAAGALRPPAQVPTIVLNGSGVKGAAKKYSDALATYAYDLTNPTGGNATATTPIPTTQVLYGPGFAREAAAVALAIGAPPSSVAALGTTLPGTTNGASVVVVIGTDLGNKTPVTTTSTTAHA